MILMILELSSDSNCSKIAILQGYKCAPKHFQILFNSRQNKSIVNCLVNLCVILYTVQEKRNKIKIKIGYSHFAVLKQIQR